MFTGCHHYDTEGTIDCSGDYCVIEIDKFPYPDWPCDGDYGGSIGVSAEDKKKMCEYAEPIAKENCGESGSATFSFNLEDVKENGPNGGPGSEQNFSYTCE